MGLTDRLGAALSGLGSRRLHVLVVEAPGAFDLRVRVDRAVTGRGWCAALSPADADALVVCGISPEPAFADAVEVVWGQLPGPRVRTEVSDPSRVDAVLDELAWSYQHWNPAADPVPTDHPTGQEDGDDDMSGMDDDMSGDDMSGMDGMDMSGPGGVPLASGAADRDGLEMDVLHLPLGPVLPSWPAALTVSCTLQGDVIVAVDVQLTAAQADDEPGVDQAQPLAYRLDVAAQLLDLAGAGDLAVRARRARNLSLDGADPGLVALRRRVGRTPLLRWSLRRVGDITQVTAAEHRWPKAWVGDAYDRLGRLLEPPPDSSLALTAVAAALPVLLPGAELGSARLTVASLLGHPLDVSARPSPDPSAVSA
ncbi:MAG: hypothetical protein ACR2LI_09255 [Propionibacteriaceae bacterium]